MVVSDWILFVNGKAAYRQLNGRIEVLSVEFCSDLSEPRAQAYLPVPSEWSLEPPIFQQTLSEEVQETYLNGVHVPRFFMLKTTAIYPIKKGEEEQ